jgi:hypothetical protein
VALLAIGAFLLAAPGLFAEVIRGMTPEVAAAIPRTARILGGVSVVSGGAAWIAHRHLDGALAALAVPVLVIPFASGRLMERIGDDRSARELARAIEQAAPADAEIVGIEAYPLSLPFYLRRTLTLSTDDARELTSNYIPRTVGLWQRVAGTPLRPRGWWREAALGCDRPRVFVARIDDLEAHALLQPRMPRIGQNRKYVAYGPCGGVDLA